MSDADDRYLRQINVPEWGAARQERLTRAEVLVVGCGGLGCAVSSLLARAGVGALRIADGDGVELSNLHRQVLFVEEDARAGRLKVEAAARALLAIRGDLRLESLPRRLGPDELAQLVPAVDLVVDATDSYQARYQINDACAAAGKPWIYGGVAGTSGMVMAVIPGAGACFRCLAPAVLQGPSAPEVLPPAVAMVGALQASLALQLLGGEAVAAGVLFQLDAWSGRLERARVPLAEGCPSCRAAAAGARPRSRRAPDV